MHLQKNLKIPSLKERKKGENKKKKEEEPEKSTQNILNIRHEEIMEIQKDPIRNIIEEKLWQKPQPVYLILTPKKKKIY